jgi:hypothetical protein
MPETGEGVEYHVPLTSNTTYLSPYPTHHVLTGSYTVEYIMGVAGIPKAFDRVRDIVAGNDTIRLVSDSGQEVETAANVEFVRG